MQQSRLLPNDSPASDGQKQLSNVVRPLKNHGLGRSIWIQLLDEQGWGPYLGTGTLAHADDAVLLWVKHLAHLQQSHP